MKSGKLILLLAFFLVPVLLHAQVTTSSISGTIRSGNETLTGATVKATHEPTGTTYSTSSLTGGIFNLVNLIPGGPYKLEVSFVGYQTYIQDSLYFALGENTRVDVPMIATAAGLTEVVVTGTSAARRKTGASTGISRQTIAALPTLSRSIQDYTRLTPQANGNSFGGVNNRFNNITIDGAVNNDVFGLASTGTPGGQASTTPISLDAIQEIQVVLAPYDITFGNFTGGGVNAVTRSGTNRLEGSAYYFVRNEGTVGKDPISKIKTTDFSDKQYGLRLGGPIIKNKLFFFVNGELARRNAPTLFNAGENGSAITSEEATQLSSFLQSAYNYDAGTAAPFDAKTQSDKIFSRIDWNINETHRLTVRHNYIKAFDDNITRSNTLFRFGNNVYRFNNKQNITVAELRSRFSNRISNNLIIGVHRIRDYRSVYGRLFPSIEITKGPATIQVGSERSSTANELDQDIIEITDNVKLFKGIHTFTFGTHNEFFKFRNLFINNFNGRWRFSSFNDFFINNPRQVDVTYSNVPGVEKPSSEFKASQLGFYAQDEIQLNPQFRLTAGLRVDIPVINSRPGFNAVVDSTFNGEYSTTNIPTGQLLWSPRVGFNWDVEGDRRMIIRGGAGVFSGRAPFVWVSNQFANSGLLLNSISVSDNSNTPENEVNNGNGFEPDPGQQSTVGSASRNFEVNLMSKDFKLPQVFRVNLATDIRLPGDIMATFEAMYSKTINNVLYQDINLADPVGIADPEFYNGADRRIAYAPSSSARRKNPSITNAILVSNTNKGYAYNLTAQFSKTWKNVYASLAYNHNDAADINSGLSSTALSNWEFVQVVGDPNNPPLATSAYALTHRFTGVVSFNLRYTKYLRTSVAFFYSGNSGQRFSYLVNGDLNSDGRFGNDLMYVPNNPSEIKFVDFLNADKSVRYTAAEQAAAFEDYVNGDKYLSSRRGQYTERNGSSTPWEHVIDMRIAQDFFITKNDNRHTLQVTFDIFNLTNLINRTWGRQYTVTNQAFSMLATSPSSDPEKGFNYVPGSVPWSMSFASRFQGQLGLRYSFN
ncbi:MAG: TonB-dependent receptor [Chitinophagaceae bacterium]|nr:TonB-dependent receptor [Chitinophagaceae bacterium]